MELKATCAPHYYRIVRQRRAEDRRAGLEVPAMMPHPRHSHHQGAGDPTALNQMTRGCLAGSGVCFISHKGSVQACGYLPVEAGDLRKQSFRDVWEESPLFGELRDLSKLEGKCGCCEFKQVCMGCRARAFGITGDYMDEEPFCIYEPREVRGADASRGAN
jgi:radical SAM protein with 4Fe4S-binding SPASM domain